MPSVVANRDIFARTFYPIVHIPFFFFSESHGTSQCSHVFSGRVSTPWGKFMYSLCSTTFAVAIFLNPFLNRASVFGTPRCPVINTLSPPSLEGWYPAKGSSHWTQAIPWQTLDSTAYRGLQPGVKFINKI